MNSLWNKWIFKTISRRISSVNLNKNGAPSMKRKCHRRYYINIIVSIYLSFDWQERLAINKSGSRFDETKTLSTSYVLFSKHNTSILSILSNPNVNSSLASQTKCDNVFSYPQLDHIFSHFSGTYLVYILCLLVCGNYPLTPKRGRCRNLLSIDSQLNRIDPSTNIFPPNLERGYRTKFEILLEEVFPNSIE